MSDRTDEPGRIMEWNQESLTQGARRYYDRKRDDRNLRLSRGSGIVNHHFGIGDFDRRNYPDRLTQAEITQMLHALEVRQTTTLLDQMGDVRATDRVLDAGCGRGGTAFSIVTRFGAAVDGITISPYQQEFAERIAAEHGWAARARFQVMNYLQMSFPDASFDHVLTNESTLYANDLDELFRELARVLAPAGRYTIATWCANEACTGGHDLIDSIDRHYVGRMHRRAEYLRALRRNGFAVQGCDDYTDLAIPYWELRSLWREQSGVERLFLEGHRTRTVLYLFIRATKKS